MMLGSHTMRERAGAVIAALLFLGSLLYLILCMDQSVGFYDEGITLFGADRVLRGDVPHRDFYALYGPGQFYLVAGLYKLFGTSVLIERAWTVVVSACSIVLIFFVVDSIVRRLFAVLAAIIALLWFSIIPSYGSAIIPCLAAMLSGLIFLTPALGRAGAAPRLLGAGVCAGVVMLFRYDVGVAVFGAECALLAVSTWFERPAQANRLRAIVLGLVVFGAGFAVVTMPVALVYAAHGLLPDLYFDVVVVPATTYARMRGLPLPRLWMLRKDPAEFFGVYLPLIMCAAAVPAMIAAAGMRRFALLWTLLALVILELIWFCKGFVRASVVQMSMALILCAPLAAALARPIRGRGRIGTAMATAALVVWVGVTGTLEPKVLAMIVRNVTHPPDCQVPAGLERMACFRVSPEMAETVQYVQQHTAPDDPVFIGLDRHDKIFVNDVTLAFAMNRPSATKWHHFDPGLQTSAPIQREMVGELQRVHPKLIVTVAKWDNEHEPNDSALSSGVTILDDYIRQAYQPVAKFGANTVLHVQAP
jgi:hypothetical protein